MSEWRWLCALGIHRFERLGPVRHVDVYYPPELSKPARTDTEFTGWCARCHAPMTRRIDGKWKEPKCD